MNPLKKLLGLFRTASPGGWSEDRLDMYKPRQRRIFTYWDGSKNVKVDPMVLYKSIMDVGPELGIDFKVAGSISKDNIKAHRKVIATLQRLFNVQPYAQGGLTEEEIEDLFFQFMDFNAFLKKNSSPTATPASETSAATPPSSAAAPATPSGMASGSIESVNSTVSPTPTPTAPASPTGPSLPA